MKPAERQLSDFHSAGHDPLLPVDPSEVQRQVSKWSSRSTRPVTDSTSAIASYQADCSKWPVFSGYRSKHHSTFEFTRDARLYRAASGGMMG
ncbi:MAG: hypothetical protein KJ946_06740 [Gammaproteobacteria bacterium]|nr:hypothetical protein [Gammaproteobacteria bacterium]